MKQAPDHLVKLIEPIVEGMGYECVGIEFNPHPRHGLLRVYIDSEAGVDMEDCAKVSHQISGVLDVEDPIPGNYQLEISSPGLERPLFSAPQFEKFIGSMARVNLYSAIDKRRKVTGMIVAVDGDVIQLQENQHIYKVPLQAISKACLVPDYLLDDGGQNG